MTYAREANRKLESWEVTRLIQRCRFRDSEAWERLLAHVRLFCVETAAWKYRLSRDDAEDAAQAVAIRIVQRLDQLRDAQAFPGWCRQLLHRAILDMRRERRPLLAVEVALFDAEIQADHEGPDPYHRILLRADLDRALNRLPELYRQPIKLHLLDEIPQEEVGEILGRPRSTIASQIDRGLRRLEQTVSPALAL